MQTPEIVIVLIGIVGLLALGLPDRAVLAMLICVLIAAGRR
jgi:hypothetical protein